MGLNHARTVHRSEDFHLSTVIDADAERARVVAGQYGALSGASLDDLRGVDAAIVATSTASHYALAERILNLGIPVLIEKPLTPEISTTLGLIDLATRLGVPLQCGLVERFNPAFVTAKRLIDSPIIHAQAVRHSPSAVRIASGVSEDLLIHDIDLALGLTAEAMSTVTGTMYTSPVTGFEEIAECLLQTRGGAILSMSASRMSQRKVRDWRIYTEGKLIEVDLLRQTVAIYENINQEVGSGGGASYRARTTIDYPFIERSGEPLALQLSHFASLIDGDIDATGELESIAASHTILDSFLTHARVE